MPTGAPWLALAELGVIIHEIDFDPADCTLRMDELAARLNERTKVVAVGYASNAVGTVNPIAEIAADGALGGRVAVGGRCTLCAARADRRAGVGL